MGVMSFIDVCLALIVIELGVAVAFLAYTLVKVQKTASAVEVLAYRVDDQVDQFGTRLKSSWMRTIEAAGSFFGGYSRGRRRGS